MTNTHHPSRREVLAGAAGVAAALGAAPLALGQGTQPAGLPVRQDIVTFAQDATRLGNFAGAIQEMMDRSARDPNDPKGWLANAQAHADFCSTPGPSDPDQIHFCYWFLSWHRAYITVTERKIREISGDASLAYPYWNWSTDRHIPAAFARPGSSLSSAIRFTPDRAVEDGEVDFVPDDPVLRRLGVAALSVRSFEAKSPSQISRSFGGIARPNSFGRYGNNRLEGTPHGPIHNYVGGVDDQGNGGDMSDFETAGRDPIFFAHHGNLDRLWEIWRQDAARKRTEPASDDFLNHAFAFTWLDGTPVQVAAGDTLDTTKLGYVYDNLQVLRPGAPAAIVAQAAPSRLPPIATEKLRVPLSPQGVGSGERKILEISDVEKPDRLITVGVFLKPANAASSDPGTNVGSFAAVKSGKQIAWPSQTLTFDITAAAQKYAGEELTVELIPFRLRAQSAGPPVDYPPLKYGQMRIVSEP